MIRKRALDISGYQALAEGAFSYYYKLNKTQGLKVLRDEGYKTIKSLRKSRDWTYATRESTLLRKARRKVSFIPRFFETVPVKLDGVYYAGIILEHIEGKLAMDYYPDNSHDNPNEEWIEVRDKLLDKLADNHIYHDDLHSENVIICANSKVHYVIDFSPDFVDIED